LKNNSGGSIQDVIVGIVEYFNSCVHL